MALPILSLTASADCVELVDPDGVILWMNERRRRLLASDAGQIRTGLAWLDLWAEPFRETAATALTTATNGGSGRFTAPCAAEAAHTTWWDVVLTLADDHPSRVGPVLSISRDVTSYLTACRDREELLEQERQARLAIEKENRKRDYALLVAAHELGAPLYAVRGWAQYLQLGSLAPEEAAEAIDAIARNTDRQYHLVERLLEVARFRSKRTSLTLRANPIHEIVVDAIECVRPVAASKQIALNSEITTSTRVLADFDQLQHAFSNLLLNSVKYTPPRGSVAVRCTQDGDRVTIEFSDTGAGIDAGFLGKVFEPFSQESATREPSTIGMGLGLSIVRRIVEGHDGAVRASSLGRGLGSTFIVELPAFSRSTT